MAIERHYNVRYSADDFRPGQSVMLRRSVARESGCDREGMVIDVHEPQRGMVLRKGAVTVQVTTKRGKAQMLFYFDEIDPCIPVDPMPR